MNNNRRRDVERQRAALEKHIEKLRGLLEPIRELQEDFQDVANAVDEIRSDEEDYYENMPESFQSGEKGEMAQSAIGALQSALDKIEALAEALGDDDLIPGLGEMDEALDSLEEAVQ